MILSRTTTGTDQRKKIGEIRKTVHDELQKGLGTLLQRSKPNTDMAKQDLYISKSVFKHLYRLRYRCVTTKECCVSDTVRRFKNSRAKFLGH